MSEYQVSELVTVVEDDKGCRIVIECDDRTGAGFALEKIRPVLPQAVPDDWYQRLVAQGAP